MNITAAATQPSSITTDTSTPASTTAGVGSLATTNTFLQLLVAQIKNQDPLQPTDGTQFLTQLSQFTGVEQLVAIRQGIDQLNQAKQSAPAQAQNGATAPVNSSQS